MSEGVPEVPVEYVDRLRSMCLALPEAYEEAAWVGTRWRVRQRTFAHVVHIESGWPPAYARAAGVDAASVLTFRSAGDELEVLSAVGRPFFRPPWAPGVVGMLLDDATEWDEVSELVTESYRVLAPRRAGGVARTTADDQEKSS